MNAVHPVRTVQFGDGVFLRAFIDWMVQTMNDSGRFNGSICIVKPRPGDFAPSYKAQGMQYTVALKGILDGKRVDRLQRIECISDMVNPYEDFDAYLRLAENPELRCIVSNTTESGITESPSDSPSDRPAPSFPGKLTQFLRHRYETAKTAGLSGLMILPCELIEDNAARLLELVLGHARRWYADPDFERWLKEDNTWIDTLVDRIVTGFTEAEKKRVFAETGFIDDLVAVAEPYHILALKGDESMESRLPLRASGVNAVWASDISPYRDLKVRLLNGSHTLMTMLALPKGAKTVHDALADPLIMEVLKAYQYGETIPVIRLPADECQAYFTSVLERFSNPDLVHKLEGISAKTVAKFGARILPTVRGHARRTGKPAPFAALVLAAITWRYLTVDNLPDEAPALAAFSSRAGLFSRDCEQGMASLLGPSGPWGDVESQSPGFAKASAESYRCILEQGFDEAMRRALAAGTNLAGTHVAGTQVQ